MLKKVLSPSLLRPCMTYTPKNFFDMHEYQCKELMRKYNVQCEKGDIATTGAEVLKIANSLDSSNKLVVKSQVHAGGRGKGRLTSGLQGGVQLCKTAEEVKEKAEKMLGYNLITHQTSKTGLKVNAVYVCEGQKIDKELYFAFLLDRNHQRPAAIVSVQGGMDIEQVAKTSPEAIYVHPIDVKKGFTKKDGYTIAEKLQLDDMKDHTAEQLGNLYKLFCGIDATLLEVNPLAKTEKGLYCVDAKFSVDDNAKFRQQGLIKMKKESLCSEESDPHEEKAVDAGLAYVALDGNIGCMVNGAGLAMATMDTIKLFGAEPANFLDVGGGANVDQIKTAFDILSSHPKVQAILINVFGGILRCDKLADGIVKAAKQINLKIPLIVRMSGTNFQEGSKMLLDYSKENPNFKITMAENLGDAAKKAAEIVKTM